MSYKEQAKAAEKAGTTKEITVEYVKWQKEGAEILGKLLAGSRVKSQTGEGSYVQYLFDTDEGVRKAAMGGAFDRESGPMLREGAIYRIVYIGKVDLDNGKRVNRFKVFTISEDGAKSAPMHIDDSSYDGDVESNASLNT